MRVLTLAIGVFVAAAAAQACDGTIVVHVVTDLNGNSVADPGEPGVPGAMVQATLGEPGANVVLTAVTDGSGNATFNGVFAGVSIFHPTWRVRVLSRDGSQTLAAPPDQDLHCAETLTFSAALIQTVPALSMTMLALLAIAFAAIGFVRWPAVRC